MSLCLCGESRLGGEKARGISLLEVLIAMAIITVGLLGAVALIPTGQFAIVEAVKADRSAACGRAGLAEVGTQRLLNPALWAAYEPTGTPGWYYYSSASQVAANISYGDAFVVDPLLVAEMPNIPPAQVSGLAAFPYDDQFMPRIYLESVWPMARFACLDRVTFRDIVQPQPDTAWRYVLKRLVAERIFQWSDDLAFETDASNHDQRTRGVYRRTDGQATAAPPITNPDDRLRQEYEGNYSWLMTVAPAATEIDSITGFSGKKYEVSVAVFFRRDLDFRPINPASPPLDAGGMPAERLANVVFTSGGYGGGDATIYVPESVGNAMGFANRTTSLGAQQYDAYLKVKKGAWVLLTGWQVDSRLPNRFSPPLTGQTNWRRVAQWYRVVIADDEVVPGQQTIVAPNGTPTTVDTVERRVTLAGPDWNTTAGDMTLPSIVPGTATAVLVDSVIGVYTKTIDVD